MASSGRNGIGTGSLDMKDKERERAKKLSWAEHASWCSYRKGDECDCA